MLTVNGYGVRWDQEMPADASRSSGFVRNASTSNLLSFEMNVNDSTSAIRLPRRTSALRSVIFRPAMYSCAWSLGVASAYASTVFDIEKVATEPRSPTTSSALPPATGWRYNRTDPRSCTVNNTPRPSAVHSGGLCLLSI